MLLTSEMTLVSHVAGRFLLSGLLSPSKENAVVLGFQVLPFGTLMKLHELHLVNVRFIKEDDVESRNISVFPC